MIGSRNRDVSTRKALRKQRLARALYWRDWNSDNVDYYDNLHQYSKNKIHCSCPQCQRKTRNKGRRDRKNYARSINYKASDMRKVLTMDADEAETLGTQQPKRSTKNW